MGYLKPSMGMCCKRHASHARRKCVPGGERTSEGHAEEGGQAGGHAHQRAVAQHLPARAEHVARQPAGGRAAQRQQCGLGPQTAPWKRTLL